MFLSDSENLLLLDIPKLVVDKSPNEDLSFNLLEVSDVSDNENL